MLSWKERIGNEIKMLIPIDHLEYKEVIGTVFEGERYRDGIVSMHGYDGEDYWAGCNSYSIQKTENTLPDLLDNYDYVMKMSKEEFANWLSTNAKDISPIYDWLDWLNEEHR